MSSKGLVQRWATWLAMLAVVLHALAPGMAQAMLADADLRHEICSSTGIVRLAEPAPDGSGPSSAVTSGIHCEWCLLDLAAALPPADGLKLEQPCVNGTLVASSEASFVPAPWRLAQPRAPPSFA